MAEEEEEGPGVQVMECWSNFSQDLPVLLVRCSERLKLRWRIPVKMCRRERRN
jgi:hypothetical protein